jgi:carboxymethylenebutenolidase
MIEKQADIRTADGKMGVFLSHPERHGPHPVVIFFMDAPGIREELRDMARRLATVGYYVALPNLYYRAGVEELGNFIGEAGTATRAAMMQLMESLTIAGVMRDTEALIAHVDQDPAAKDPIMCVGYCMSGQYAISAAATFPDRVAAAASIYGTRLVTDRPDSPHLAAPQAKGEIYVGCAENDHYAPAEMIARLAKSLREHGVNAEVEIYPAVDHGFAFPQRGAYNQQAAERHWERLFALFRRVCETG